MTRLHPRHLVKFHFFEGVILWIFRLLPFVALLIFLWSQTNLIMTRNYIYTEYSLPKSFVGYKIMHVSDIANSSNNVAVIAQNEKPDVIVLTGGYADDNGNSNNTIRTIEKLASIAPVYYIYNTDDTSAVMDSTSAINLVGQTTRLESNVTDVNTFINDNYGNEIIKQYENNNERAVKYVEYVKQALEETKNSTIILCGMDTLKDDEQIYDVRDKVFELIGTDANDVAIMLNGDFRTVNEICLYTNTDMMFMGGTLGTNRKSSDYKKGLYGNNGTELFVSGGIGTREGVTRLLNPPEVQIITLSDGTLVYHTPLEEFISKIIPDVGTIFDNDGGFQKYTYEYTNESYE